MSYVAKVVSPKIFYFFIYVNDKILNYNPVYNLEIFCYIKKKNTNAGLFVR